MEQKFVKTHFVEMNLSDVIEQLGEGETKSILSSFTCPLNKDVENFIKHKAIEFSKRTTSKTHLVFWQTEDGEHTELVGYYTVSMKTITISKSVLSANEIRKLTSQGCEHTRAECRFPAPLIAQLGKNYTSGNDTLISGPDLLQMAINKIRNVQKEVGGRFIYLECEDKKELLEFYNGCNFKVFGKRELDKDEDDIQGSYLIQLFAMIS
ncbi:N-acetyltransferase [Kineothrix sp. MB12-C1]|uniref:N-acetyltransferase n=1 Tax=Kineothrix sp. MB12-C1 TaxID=3070215 RepID=UPI0027D31029|nr:N-acetyltransferase [Kineothrix sp. MB12-C1]WMC91272.1 N-acetyltransferase [Kineothrix sp. MB12-C1]